MWGRGGLFDPWLGFVALVTLRSPQPKASVLLPRLSFQQVLSLPAPGRQSLYSGQLPPPPPPPTSRPDEAQVEAGVFLVQPQSHAGPVSTGSRVSCSAVCPLLPLLQAIWVGSRMGVCLESGPEPGSER